MTDINRLRRVGAAVTAGVVLTTTAAGCTEFLGAGSRPVPEQPAPNINKLLESYTGGTRQPIPEPIFSDLADSAAGYRDDDGFGVTEWTNAAPDAQAVRERVMAKFNTTLTGDPNVPNPDLEKFWIAQTTDGKVSSDTLTALAGWIDDARLSTPAIAVVLPAEVKYLLPAEAAAFAARAANVTLDVQVATRSPTVAGAWKAVAERGDAAFMSDGAKLLAQGAFSDYRQMMGDLTKALDARKAKSPFVAKTLARSIAAAPDLGQLAKEATFVAVLLDARAAQPPAAVELGR